MTDRPTGRAERETGDAAAGEALIGLTAAASVAPLTKSSTHAEQMPKRRAMASYSPGSPDRGADALGRVHGVVRHRNVHPPRQEGAAPKPGGRTRFTEQQLVAALWKAGGVHAEACRILMRAHGYTVGVGTFGRLVASSPALQAAKEQVTQIALDYVESALMRKIEAGDDKAIQFFLRFKGASRGYALAVKHAGDPDGAPIKTETAFKFDDLPLDQVRALHEAMAAARAAAIDAARLAVELEE